MKKSMEFIIILTIVLLISVIFLAANKDKKSEESEKTGAVFVSADTSDDEYMRGMWVSYITLDMNNSDRSFESFKLKFDKITEDAIMLGVNTLIVQVRPFSDALYDSDIYPASHILSGEQGLSPSYDALSYMCSASHSKGLKIHAWINPYRVATASSPEHLSEDNPYYLQDDIGFETSSGIYLNPANDKARETIIAGVSEIVRNYDIDGIQFDDYFYPRDIDNLDSEDYEKYLSKFPDSSSALPLKLWRQNNVNLLLAETYLEIKRINPAVVFGVSPQGNIQNDYDMGADVKAWCETIGYMDYICPQMYYSRENPQMGFEECLKAWKEFDFHENLKVYVGIGAYKLNTDADNGTWENNTDELREQLTLIEKHLYDGYMIYDYNAAVSTENKEAMDVFRDAVYEEISSPAQ